MGYIEIVYSLLIQNKRWHNKIFLDERQNGKKLKECYADGSFRRMEEF